MKIPEYFKINAALALLAGMGVPLESLDLGNMKDAVKDVPK